MVLTYTYGLPARWVARVDPLSAKRFQLSVMYDSNKLELANDSGPNSAVIFKNPFTISSPVGPGLGVVTVSGANSTAALPSGDVDVFEIVFKEIGSPRPGQLASVFTENFDGVVAPALPAGWTAGNASGPAPLWVTSTSGVPSPPADTPPNAAFVDDPAVVSDKRLDSPSIPITTGAGQLTFRNNFNLESGFDGGVLEISIGGGAFTDILVAGGSFVTGGYNGTISAGFGSPLANRPAWSGNSGGFITTTVNLPASAAGQNIVLRFRMGSDDSGSAAGWRIDNISINDGQQPPFTAFANNATNDFIDAVDPATQQTVHFSANEIAPTTRTFTDNVFPHTWDPDGVYDSGHTGGPGTWDTSSISWDDLPSAIPFSPPFADTPWNNGTHAHDIAVFGGDPGSGIVTVSGSISVGGFQFDISGYNIQGGTLQLSSHPGLTPIIDTGANNAMISSSITGSNGLTKIGTGTLALTGPNTYTGSTTINAGTLLVGGGSGTGNTFVLANSGGTIGGNGTISGPVNVSTGGSVLGGNGTLASSLTLTNNLNLNDESIIKLALGPGPSFTHSTLNRAAGPGIWIFDSNQGFTIVNLGAQPGFYDNIITGLAVDPDPAPGTGLSWHINNPGFTGSFVYDGTGNIDLTLSAVPPPFALSNAVSRKNHGAAGNFNIPLPPISPFGVECRSGGAGGNHTLVFTFTNNVASGSVSLARVGTGSVSGTPGFAGNTMIVNLTGVSNAQLITLTLSGVTDNFAQVLPDIAVSMRVLAGDVIGNGSVNATDISQTKLQSGATVINANFRADVVVTGSINGTDISLVKAASGTAVPKPAQ